MRISLISEGCDSTSRSRHYHQALRGTACKDCVLALVVLHTPPPLLGDLSVIGWFSLMPRPWRANQTATL